MGIIKRKTNTIMTKEDFTLELSMTGYVVKYKSFSLGGEQSDKFRNISDWRKAGEKEIEAVIAGTSAHSIFANELDDTEQLLVDYKILLSAFLRCTIDKTELRMVLLPKLNEASSFMHKETGKVYKNFDRMKTLLGIDLADEMFHMTEGGIPTVKYKLAELTNINYKKVA